MDFRFFPFAVAKCPQCFAVVVDRNSNWCNCCGFLLLGFEELIPDMSVPPPLLLEDTHNLRQAFVQPRITQHLFSTTAATGTSVPPHQSQRVFVPQPMDRTGAHSRRQKFASENLNDVEQMRRMLNHCFANENNPSGHHVPGERKWPNSSTNTSTTSHINGKKKRPKGRSCSRPAICMEVPAVAPPAGDSFLCEADFVSCETAPCDDRRNFQFLPIELWLRIAKYLGYQDRANLALTCRRLSDCMRDGSLWRQIILERRKSIKDAHLHAMSTLKPRKLHFLYCRGPDVTLNGVNGALANMGPTLTHLSFVGCSKGIFDGDSFLLTVVDRCPNLQHLDASYAYSMRDQTLVYIAKNMKRLISLLLNGAQLITNRAICKLVKYQSNSLERLELFGCFKLNSDIFRFLGNCQSLRVLAFGYLHHLSATGLVELLGKLPRLASLDLRGTMKLVNDSNLTQLADHCPMLEEFFLANMKGALSEFTVAEMLRRLQRLRVLDFCGLMVVGDLAMEVLATSCPYLEQLDVSCTSVTEKGLEHLVQKPALWLHTMRVSYCKLQSIDVLKRLIDVSPRLTSLIAYGFEHMPNFANELREQRSQSKTILLPLLVETDSASSSLVPRASSSNGL